MIGKLSTCWQQEGRGVLCVSRLFFRDSARILLKYPRIQTRAPRDYPHPGKKKFKRRLPPGSQGGLALRARPRASEGRT